MADITTDPYTACYKELMLILTDSSDFTTRVKPGNRIMYTGSARQQDPEKEEISSDDFIEVRLVPAGIRPHLQWTSNSSRSTAMYAIEIRTGSMNIEQKHYPVIWAVYKAMRPWATRLASLTIAENSSGRFVMLTRPIGEITEGIERGEVSGGIEGWFSIWKIEVDMQFTSSALT